MVARRNQNATSIGGRLEEWTRDWHKVSVDAVRAGTLLLLVGIVAVVAWFGFRQLHRQQLELAAIGAIAECETLLSEITSAAPGSSFAGEVASARVNLARAKVLLRQRQFSASLNSAQQSRRLLGSILDALGLRGSAGAAQFVEIQGEVVFRHGTTGVWLDAAPRVLLRPGDFVRTADGGSAEIMFFDGTLYRLRANTLFVVTQSTQTRPADRRVELRRGWLDLSTGELSSRVTTPDAVARVASQSAAGVSYDPAGRTQVRSYRGRVEVQSLDGGETRHLQSLETVIESNGQLSAVRSLPPRPALLTPLDNLEFVHQRDDVVELRWHPVESAVSYALEVGANRLFTDPIIATRDRTRTNARLGIRGTGSFLWRVAAIDAEGRQGPWSYPRKFRIVESVRTLPRLDETPPELTLEPLRAYGSLFIVQGRTEPGTTLSLNGELVTVQMDGSFTRTIQFKEEGWSQVKVRAVDPRGNETVRTRRVFVESL